MKRVSTLCASSLEAKTESAADFQMHYCEMELQGPVLALCDERATVKVQNCWFCEFHANALEQYEARWSGIDCFPLTYEGTEKQADNPIDEDGRFWDDEDKN